MQTTLLGLAIAFIIALVAALIGPHFVDWNRFRPQFEAEATRVVGLPVRVDGAIDARLLPIPSLRFKSVAIGRRFDDSNATADQLDVEFSLGSLMRGEWRADQLTINGLVFDAGLDDRGRITWAARSGGFDAGALTIDRLNVTGALTLRDAASKSLFVLDDIAFRGDVRPGSLRGEGSFVQRGAHTPFRLTLGKPVAGEGLRLHVNLDPGAHPVAADLDGVVTLRDAAPRFDGALAISRPPPPGGASAKDAPAPWRVTGKVRADPSQVRIEQIEAQYGPEQSALKLTGVADLRLGASPLFQAVLTARQLDADRMLAREGQPPPTPAEALAGLQDFAAALPLPPIATQIALSSDLITLGQRPLQNFGADLRGEPDGWTADRLELRAPGATRVVMSARASGTGDAAQFGATANVESADADTLLSWLRGRSDAAWRPPRPLRLSGDVALSRGGVAVENLTAEFDGHALSGRFALGGEAAARRLDATLSAERLDLDALLQLAREAGNAASLPNEARLTLDATQATLSGRELKPFALTLNATPNAIALDRLSIGAPGGLVIEGSGLFDRAQTSGKATINGRAASLSRFADLVAPFSADMARRIASVPAGQSEAKVALTLSLEKGRGERAVLNAAAQIDAPQIAGRIDAVWQPTLAAVLGFDGDALAQSDVSATAKLSAPKGDALAALAGLDGVIALGDKSAQFDARVEGARRGAFKLKAKLSGETIDADLDGHTEPSGARSGLFDLAIRKADVAPLFGALQPVRVTLASRVTVSGERYTFENLDLSGGGSRLRGKVSVTATAAEPLIEGDIGLDTADLSSALATAIGAAGHGSQEPLAQGWLKPWRGRLSFSALRATLAGAELRAVSAVLRSDGASLAVDQLSGGLGGGEAKADLVLRRVGGETALNATLKLANVDGAALRWRGLAMPLGRVSMQAALAGSGRSAASIVGALTGTGTVTLDRARVVGVDPAVFDAAARAGEAGTVASEAALRAVVNGAISGGSLRVQAASIPFVVKEGVLRVASTVLSGEGARLVVAGGYDIAADQIDLRADLSPTGPSAAGSRPEIQVMLFGTPDAPDRMVDFAALTSWLGMRAIEREMRRLESLERGNKPTEPAPSQIPAITPATPVFPSPEETRAPLLPPAVEVRPAPGAARPPAKAPPAAPAPPRPPMVIAPGAQRPAASTN